MEFLLKLEVPSDPMYLCVVRGAVWQMAKVSGFSEEDCHQITLAVDEAMSNIIRHAYDGRTGQPIKLQCRRTRQGEAEGIEFLLHDHGRPVERQEIRGRPLGELRPGGLGTHLIAEIMDRAEYEARADGNHLRLVKYRNSRKGE